jgi:tetratricopeptide (TPR) repeat protein
MTDRPRGERTTARLEDCFHRGAERAAARDFDYAHAMFSECVEGDPGNLKYVEALLANLQARHGERRKRPGGRLTRGLRAAVERQQWDEALWLGIATLEGNPWHVATLHVLAQACEALHLNEVELAYLKAALDADPRDPDVNRHCARSLARMGQFDQAIACWRRVERHVPGDREAAEMIGRLAEEKLRWAAAPEARDPRQAASPTVAEAAAGDEPPTAASGAQGAPPRVELTARQQLESAIVDAPADVGNYLALAKLLVEQGEFDQAERWLERAERNCAQRAAIQQARENVQTQRAAAAAALERQQRDRQRRTTPRGVPWLEMLLVAAFAGLVVQLVPGWQAGLAEFGRRHLRALLIVLNVVVLLALVWWNQRSKNA